MIVHKVKVYPSKIKLQKKNQLAWKIAEIASDNAKLNKEAIEMVINRIIDNASVAIASLNRRPVISSREMALKHQDEEQDRIKEENRRIKEWEDKFDLEQQKKDGQCGMYTLYVVIKLLRGEKTPKDLKFIRILYLINIRL